MKKQNVIILPIEGYIVEPFSAELRSAVAGNSNNLLNRIATAASYKIGMDNKYTADLSAQISGILNAAPRPDINANRDALKLLAHEYDIVFHTNMGTRYEILVKDALEYGALGFGARALVRDPYEPIKKSMRMIAGNCPVDVFVMDENINVLRMARDMSMRPVMISRDIGNLALAHRMGILGYKTIADFACANMLRPYVR